jgi:hypothetical protein
MSKIIEIFGTPAGKKADEDWCKILERQWCPYLDRKCIKVRKSQPKVSIGTCSVLYGEETKPIIICPFRLLERRQIFTDCLHLLSVHEPGNELHIIPEISIPGGSVDYFLASVKHDKVRDFVGIELQTLDTTGTVWPERQRFIKSLGLPAVKEDPASYKPFGMNWKMTAKTILIQLHHKIQTFEHINKHLVLVIQDHLLSYLQKEFQFSHMKDARVGDPMHIHSYVMKKTKGRAYRLDLNSRLSTDTEGIALSLGLQAEANMELETIVKQLESKISAETLFTVG